MPSRNVDLATIEEWKELGFFYSSDGGNQSWTLIGDRNGLYSGEKKLAKVAGKAKPDRLPSLGRFLSQI